MATKTQTRSETAEDTFDYTFEFTGLHTRLFQVLRVAYDTTGGDHEKVKDALAEAVFDYFMEQARIHRQRVESAKDRKRDLERLGSHSAAIAQVDDELNRAEEAKADAIDNAQGYSDAIRKSYDRALRLLDTDHITFENAKSGEVFDNGVTHEHTDAPVTTKVTTTDGDTSEYAMFAFSGSELCGCPSTRFYSPMCKHTIARLLNDL